MPFHSDIVCDMKVQEFKNGIAINGTFPDDEVIDRIKRESGLLPLISIDPPYGSILNEKWDKADDDVAFCKWMIDWTKKCAELTMPNGSLYVFGGTGKPHMRPFYRYLVEAELQTPYRLANHITWGKRRAYGVNHNYLYTREELAYFTLGDIKKPRLFNIPLLETKRGYAGYNAKYPAKSEYLRRTNVWTDITEMFSGKTHPSEKPVRLMEIPIQVHTNPGEWVLDCFAGSGPTGEAAIRNGRKFVLVEQDETYFDGLVERLKKVEEEV
jgi:DNA modification methylase